MTTRGSTSAGATSGSPDWGREAHKTLGNWYTTILNAYGNPIKHFGAFDLALKGDQSGPIQHPRLSDARSRHEPPAPRGDHRRRVAYRSRFRFGMVLEVIVDTHVHLWHLDRPEGIYWIEKDNQALYRSFLPADHAPVAKANGVSGVVMCRRDTSTCPTTSGTSTSPPRTRPSIAAWSATCPRSSAPMNSRRSSTASARTGATSAIGCRGARATP
ncbi:MAG: hypothetical protein R3F11_15355 [Verrucomicrobiales bacterium]